MLKARAKQQLMGFTGVISNDISCLSHVMFIYKMEKFSFIANRTSPIFSVKNVVLVVSITLLKD